MIGLDAAGKTTILYKLHLGEVVSTYPTIGSNVEEVTYRNMRFQVWDLGGQEMLRQTWKTYFINTHALIMVIDSADSKRLDLARKELHAVLDSDELRDACVLIFANKQDLRDAVTPAELSEALSLHSIRTHDWHIQVRKPSQSSSQLPFILVERFFYSLFLIDQFHHFLCLNLSTNFWEDTTGMQRIEGRGVVPRTRVDIQSCTKRLTF